MTVSAARRIRLRVAAVAQSARWDRALARKRRRELNVDSWTAGLCLVLHRPCPVFRARMF
jgi:hypothetical protein